MSNLKITLTRSSIGSSKRQKDTLVALGLRKTNHSVELQTNPQINGMIEKVRHLIKIEEI